MNWEDLIAQILTEFKVSDLIVSDSGEYCVLAMGTANKRTIPDELKGRWGEFMELLFPNHPELAQGEFPKDVFTVEGGVTLGGGRFRLSALRHSKGYSVVMRLLPVEIPKPSDIDLYPGMVKRFCEIDHGLVLVIGPTGSGKSTTIASLIQERMKNRAENMVTIEDPIEFVYPTDTISNIFQREVGRDCHSFGLGLRDALRQAPHLVMIGEIRDEETALTALKAAESGHIVVATLHAHSVDQACMRYVKLLANYNPENICDALAGTLQLGVAQTLIYNEKLGHRVSLHEVMYMTNAIAAHIRAQRFERIPNELMVGSRIGQISWEQSVNDRVARNLLPDGFQMHGLKAS